MIVADINQADGESVASENPSNLVFHKTNVTSAQDWKSVIDAAFSRFGRLDILVNNAGTTYRNKVRYLVWG